MTINDIRFSLAADRVHYSIYDMNGSVARFMVDYTEKDMDVFGSQLKQERSYGKARVINIGIKSDNEFLVIAQVHNNFKPGVN